jgi:hypothetical protein
MPRDLSYWDYVKAAFHAKPDLPGLGSVPVNKLGVLGVGVLGGAALLAAPPVGAAIWLLGGAAELGYLCSLSSSERFQAHIRRLEEYGEQQTAEERKTSLLTELSDGNRQRYEALERQCTEVQPQAGREGTDMTALHLTGLSQLLWIFLRMLASAETLRGYLASGAHKEIVAQIKALEEELKSEDPDERVGKSKQATLDILKRRYEQLKSATRQLRFIESELQRIEQQVALLKEEALLNRDPEFLSGRIDAVTKTLDETNEWMRSNAELISTLDAGPSPAVMMAAMKGGA